MTDGFADITSANTVGWTKILIPAGYSLFTPVFKGVGGGTFDLHDVVVTDTKDQALEESYNDIRLNKMVTADGSYAVKTYAYDSDDGWNCDYAEFDDGTFYVGEGIYINNGSGQDVYFKISGEVDFVCVNAIPNGYTLWGNAYPRSFYLKDVVVTDQTGAALEESYNDIRLNKMVLANGSYEVKTYAYDSDDGWNCDYAPIPTVTLNPGEGIYVNNGSGTALYFTVPNPERKE